MKLQATGIICVILLTSAGKPTVNTVQWAPVKNKDGIAAFVGMANKEGIAPTRVEMTVPASPEKVVRTIADMDNYKLWVPYCKTSFTIQKVSDTVCYGYQRISAPMVTDRDVAVRCTVRKTSHKNYEVLITGVPNFVKAENRALRIQYLVSRYHVYADAAGLTHIDQVNEVDIGGSIPGFLLSWASKNQPYETFQNLRNLLTF